MRGNRELLDSKFFSGRTYHGAKSRAESGETDPLGQKNERKIGTDYIHLGGAGRYTGLSGIALFYQDIGEKLGILEEIDPIIQQEIEDVQERTKEAKEKLGNYHCVLMSRSIQGSAFSDQTLCSGIWHSPDRCVPGAHTGYGAGYGSDTGTAGTAYVQGFRCH